MLDKHLVHCVGGCSRGKHRDLSGLKPSEVTCDHCGSNKIAIWHEGRCLYAYSGKVEYPFGNKQKVGDPVKGPVK